MKNNKTTTNRNSMKGKKGTVGAPPKHTRWPASPFSTAQLFTMNSKGVNAQCQLSLRTKLDARLEDGTVIQLASRKQKGGAVGRPKTMYVLKTNFDKTKHVKFGTTGPVKTRTVRAVQPQVAPATPPAENVEIPLTATPAVVSPVAETVNTLSLDAVIAATNNTPEMNVAATSLAMGA